MIQIGDGIQHGRFDRTHRAVEARRHKRSLVPGRRNRRYQRSATPACPSASHARHCIETPQGWLVTHALIRVGRSSSVTEPPAITHESRVAKPSCTLTDEPSITVTRLRVTVDKETADNEVTSVTSSSVILLVFTNSCADCPRDVAYLAQRTTLVQVRVRCPFACGNAQSTYEGSLQVRRGAGRFVSYGVMVSSTPFLFSRVEAQSYVPGIKRMGRHWTKPEQAIAAARDSVATGDRNVPWPVTSLPSIDTTTSGDAQSRLSLEHCRVLHAESHTPSPSLPTVHLHTHTDGQPTRGGRASTCSAARTQAGTLVSHPRHTLHQG